MYTPLLRALALFGCGADGVGDPCADLRCETPACLRHCDTDGDGFLDLSFRGGDDCDDADPDVHPGAPEVCDGVDDNCDGLIDDADPLVDDAGKATLYVDQDGDGVGRDATVRRCAVGPGVAAVYGDCDDRDPLVSPLVPEVCDGFDDDCDDLVDLDDPSLGPLPTLFQDRDGDGHGDPSVATSGCPADGWALDALDCDDTDATVHGLADELCDGRDTDCDGALGPDEGDGDGDGDPVCADCDDADPLRSSRLEERCGGLDDDCDGLVDEADPSLNPYTCGYCPPDDVTLADPAIVHNETWNPCVIDPTSLAMCSTDPAEPDTNEHGERLHRVAWREDEGHWRDELFVFLPPGPGRENNTIRTWAAYAGYRTISLGYPNDDNLEAKCANENADDCYRNALFETTYGVDLSVLEDVGPQDSIVVRLATLLDHLAVEHPEMGFDRYLTPEGAPDWPKIVVAGWSGGGGQAAFLGHYEPIAGAWLMSAPKDHGEDVLAPVDWVSAPSVTPGCAMFGAWHVDEPYSDPPYEILLRAWDEMGIPDTRFDLDQNPGLTPPPGTHRVSQSVDVTTLADGCNAHGSVGRDKCMRDEVFPSYLYLLCALPDLDPLTCAD
ncbi:MAG: putative metal-binding motif-containing protein [Myxococcota bacterium]